MATSGSDVPTSEGHERRHVFIEAGVLLVEEPSPDRRHEARRVLAPGAADAVTLLAEGHEVAVVDGESGEAAALSGLVAVATVPTSFPAGSWYITTDETWCEGDRPNGLRSILVGPKRPPARRPTLRCDLEARDLNAAVMEILIRETMA